MHSQERAKYSKYLKETEKWARCRRVPWTGPSFSKFPIPPFSRKHSVLSALSGSLIQGFCQPFSLSSTWSLPTQQSHQSITNRPGNVCSILISTGGPPAVSLSCGYSLHLPRSVHLCWFVWPVLS